MGGERRIKKRKSRGEKNLKRIRENETMKTNVIKMRFTIDGKPYGMEYTYYTLEEVQVGDYVEVKTYRGVSIGQVTEINVPLEEIERFGDRAKYILGKHIQEEKQEEVENEQQ